ncbi:UNVERIFIED_CONTAM: hypothetical protein Slati_1769100 [Sesamum latifolium]|uniref:Reverse transcriptase domain-containing protein n=1 Tax=Sesamum latifolium TaxID=2727402 RepID=A0AAW2WX08_9LAMI
MQDNPNRLKSDKYCRFHRDMGHTTEECHHLQNEIEKLIQQGHLKEYVKHYPQGLQFVGGPSAPPRELTSNPTPCEDNFPIAESSHDLKRTVRKRLPRHEDAEIPGVSRGPLRQQRVAPGPHNRNFTEILPNDIGPGKFCPPF